MLLASEVQLEPMPPTDRGVEHTLRKMEALVTRGVRAPLVIQTARSLIAHLPEKDPRREAETLFEFVRASVRYVRDPVGVELLRGPEIMLREIRDEGRSIGDCDELAVLLAALLRAVGIRTRFRVASFQRPRAGDDSRFSHVYLEAHLENAWVALDPTNKVREMGWAPASRAVRRAAIYEEGEMRYLNGLGQPATQDPGQGGIWDIFQSVASTALPLLERYGVLPAPRTYAPSGQKVYLPTMPVRPTATGFLYQQATAPVQVPFVGAMSQGQLALVLGAGAVVLFLVMRR